MGNKARVEYTVERRIGPVRMAKEVPVDKVQKLVERLVEKHGAYNFDIRYERPTNIPTEVDELAQSATSLEMVRVERARKDEMADLKALEVVKTLRW